MSLTDPRPPASRPPAAGGGEDLRFLRTAPRHLVARSAIAEVFITDWRRLTADRFRLAAQWPRTHSFYTPVAGTWYDPLLVAETLRQAAVLVGQEYFGVPADARYHMSELEFDIVPGVLLVGVRPAELHLETAVTEVRSAPGRGAALAVEMELLRDGAFAGAGRLTLTASGPPGRGGAPDVPGVPLAEPVPPAIVGRLDASDVVLGTAAGPAARRRDLTWALRIDPGHPTLFDGDTDETPGMVLLEAARQAVQAACAPYRVLPVELRSVFHAPLSQTVPSEVSAVRLPTRGEGEEAALRVAVWQLGRLAFDSLVVATLCD